ncbi:MAG: T9SS type A sorting domain-containing protein, partial [bacterium]|nr:T9SS type A sorting domain-containing protein [bacterium]
SGSGITTLGNALNIVAGASPGIVTVGGTATLAAAGNLNLNSDVSGTASIANSAGSITGNVTVQRFIPATAGRKYRYLAAPFATGPSISSSWQQNIYITGSGSGGTTCPALTSHSNGFDASTLNNSSMLTFDETTATLVSSSSGLDTYSNAWKSVASTNTTNLSAGIGYNVFIRGNRTQGCALLTTPSTTANAVTLSATGSIQTGTFPFVVTYNALNGEGWNLIGNPYPSEIDWDAATGWTKTNVASTYYIYSPVGDNFATYNSTGPASANGGTRYIPSGQAFYIQANAAAPLLSCAESVKTATNNAPLLKGNKPFDIRVEIINSANKSDESFFYLNRNQSDSFDLNYDMEKMGNPSNVNVYSIDSKGKKYVGNNIANIKDGEEKICILGIGEAYNGNYTMNVAAPNMPNFYQIFFRDHFLKTERQLMTEDTIQYAFSVTNDLATAGNSRFDILIKNLRPHSTGIVNSLAKQSIITVFPNPSSDLINLRISNGLDQTESLTLTNTLGQVLITRIKPETNSSIDLSEMAPGIYFINARLNNGSMSTLKVIKK